MVDFKAIDRIMGNTGRQSVRDRYVAERRNHQFSQDIGGCSDNYVEPKFGSEPTENIDAKR